MPDKRPSIQLQLIKSHRDTADWRSGQASMNKCKDALAELSGQQQQAIGVPSMPYLCWAKHSNCAKVPLHYLPSSLCTGVSRSRFLSLGRSLSRSRSLSLGLSLQQGMCVISGDKDALSLLNEISCAKAGKTAQSLLCSYCLSAAPTKLSLGMAGNMTLCFNSHNYTTYIWMHISIMKAL